MIFSINGDNRWLDTLHGLIFVLLLDQTYCPRRVSSQTAKTRGGTLQVPAYIGRRISP